MATKRWIVLIGLRGSGKSTVGELLSERLKWGFVDLDDRTLDLLREEHGVESIADAFEQLGEPMFRDAEYRALHGLLDHLDEDPRVVALGGGTPMAPGAAELLRETADRASLVYLRLKPEVLARRLRGQIDDRRPALVEGSDPISEIDQIHAQRDPLYHALAALTIEEDGAAAEVVERICEELSV